MYKYYFSIMKNINNGSDYSLSIIIIIIHQDSMCQNIFLIKEMKTLL